jgi:hypothetical protein
MQIKTGTAAVTNGSPTVVAPAGVDWSAATSNSFFSLDAVRGAPLYAINSRALVAGAWQLTLATPYGEVTNLTAAYLIQKDFITFAADALIFYFAIFEAGDTQTLPLINRNTASLTAALSALRDRPSLRLWNPDQNLYFTVTVRGALGAEELRITTPGSA